MRQVCRTFFAMLLVLLTSCATNNDKFDEKRESKKSNLEKTEEKGQLKKVEKAEKAIPLKMNITINDTTISATLEDNEASKKFIEMIKDKPLTIIMDEYAGFEKIGSLNTSLPSEDTLLDAQSGDIVLYNGNNIVIFYGTNMWQYTKLGKIDNVEQWMALIEEDKMSLTFSLANQ